MGAQSTSTTLETLQAEFSPPLDTSLIAAMAADYIADDWELSDEHLRKLRQALAELAAQAEKDENSLAFQLSCDLQITPSDVTTSMDGHDLFSCNGDASVPYTATTSNVSTGSDSNVQPFSSPLGFLQTAFPHLATSRLKSALGSSEDADEVDMEAVVESILATEFVKELEERGLSEEEGLPPEPWQAVKKKQGKKKKGNTITLGDVRQQQHVRRPSTPSTSRGAPLDPWTQVTSFASRLSDLLPSHSPSYFQSLFHSPQYTSPADALRSGLASMKPISQASFPELHGEISEDTDLVLNIFDMITSDGPFADLAESEQDRLMYDVNIAVNAALAAGQGRDEAASIALELVSLLHDLDDGTIVWNVYHSPAPTPSSSLSPNGKAPKSTSRSVLPSGPPSPPPVRSRRSTLSTPDGVGGSSLNAWQTVPVISRGPLVNPHALFIPAYNPDARLVKSKKGRKINGVATPNEKKLDVLDPVWHRQRAGELMERSKEALVQASRAWQRGNAKTRGGEVALTYAERARELQEQAHAESLHAAWDMTQAKRLSSVHGSTIDLHGTTVAEAIHIVTTMLEEEPATFAKPLKIITGRGNHSINGIGVLRPAVQTALTNDGWNVTKWDGGLVVRGRTSR